MNFELLYQTVIEKLSNELPHNLYYHGVHHTKDVLAATSYIAEQEGIEKEEQEILKIAALIHDIGFCHQYIANEKIGAMYAVTEMSKHGYPIGKCELVSKLIMSTQMHKAPSNNLEEILSDADFDYFGRKDFHAISETLRRELNENGYNYNNQAWDRVQVKFLQKHRFYTTTAIKKRLPKKLMNLAEIKMRLTSY